MAVSEDNQVAFKIAHLNMIQGAITRMSEFSASAKTFTVTILAGLAAITLQADKVLLGFVALFAITVLFTVDVYYMTFELRFRALYHFVENRDLDKAHDLSIKPLKKSDDVVRALTSRIMVLFYLPVFSACLAFIVYGWMYERPTTSQRVSESAYSDTRQSANAKAHTSSQRIGQPAQPITKPSTRSAR